MPQSQYWSVVRNWTGKAWKWEQRTKYRWLNREVWDSNTIFQKNLWRWQTWKLELDSNSLYLARSEKKLLDVILPEKLHEWKAISLGDYTDTFTANATSFFARLCCITQHKQDKKEPDLYNEELWCTKLLCFCSQTYCCYDRRSKKYKFSRKSLNKRTLGDCGDEPY